MVIICDAILAHGERTAPPYGSAQLHQVHDEYAGLLKGMAVHETVFDNLDAAVEQSLTHSSDERSERLARANRQPEQVVVLLRAFRRNPDVIAEVLLRANRAYEGCERSALFWRTEGHSISTCTIADVWQTGAEIPSRARLPCVKTVIANGTTESTVPMTSSSECARLPRLRRCGRRDAAVEQAETGKEAGRRHHG